MQPQLPEKYRFNFDLGNNFYTRFITIHRTGADDYHFYFFGLNGEKPKLLARFIHQESLNAEEIKAATYKWEELQYESKPKEISYLSFHPVEMVFRLQLKDRPAEYIRYDKDVGGYIDLRLISDLPELYPRQNRLPGDAFKISTGPGELYIVFGSWSIGQFDLRDHPFSGQTVRGQATQGPGRFFFAISGEKVPDKHLKNRPRGTVSNFLFHNVGGTYSRASFLVG